MTLNRAWALGALLVMSTAMADEPSQPLSQMISPEDYTAAGLAKLTPEERAALDRIFEKYRSGAMAAAEQRAQAAERAAAEAKSAQLAAQEAADQARQEAAAAKAQAEAQTAVVAQAQQAEAQAKAQAAESAKAAEAAKKASGQSFLSKAEAVLMPGTKITYAAEESHIVGTIKGWGPKSAFLLENGQQWQVADGTSYFNIDPVTNPKVEIRPAKIFGFEMHIEHMGYFRVKLLSGPTYREEKP